MTVIAWIGLGNMGGPMSAKLVAAGHEVRGFDLSEEALAAAAAHGVRRADSAAAAAAGAGVVFTMLPAGKHVRGLYLGSDDPAGAGTGGLLDAVAPGTVLVDSSTIDVASAAEVHEAAAARGLDFLDAPVSGGMSGAAAGTLTFMVGGSPDVIEGLRGVLEPMAGNVIATGAPGSGQATKIVNNMLAMISNQAMAEAAVLAERLGLDQRNFWEVAQASSGDSWPLRHWYPVPGVVETAAANRDFEATFAAALAHKDVGLAMAAAKQHGLDLPAAGVAYEGLQRLMDAGDGDKDCTLVIRNVDTGRAGEG